MKRKLIFCTVATLLFLSCSDKEIREDAIYDPKEPETAEIIKQSNELLNQADYIFMRENYLVELYVQDSTKQEIIRVPNFENIPAGLIATYNIIRYKSGEIMYVAEFPYSTTGDWENIYESVFDETGKLLKFVRKSRFIEKDNLVSEKSEYYYNSKHKLLKKTYECMDQNNKNIADDNELEFKFRFPYNKHFTRAEWLEAHGLKK